MMKQLTYYDKALEIDPRYTNAWNGMGVIQGILGKSQEAVSCFEKVIEIDAGNIYAWNDEGQAFFTICKSAECHKLLMTRL